MSNTWPRAQFSEFLRLNRRPYTLGPDEDANLVGMRLYGAGPFHRELKPALRIRKKSHFIIKAGDIIYNKLFAWKGTFGLVPSTLDGMFVSDKFPTYELDRHKVDEHFLRWYFRWPPLWDEALAMSTGSAAISKLTLNPPKFLLLTMPLPSLDEQRRIVARIDELSAKIEEARDLRRATEVQSELIWKARARRIVESIPQNVWQPLGHLVDIQGGGTPSKANPSFWGGKIRWVCPRDMKHRMIADSIGHITESAVTSSSVKMIDPGAVLVVVRGMILVHTFPSAVLNVLATVNQDMKALVPRNDVLPEYLVTVFWALNSDVLALVERSSHDTRRLPTARLLSFRIPVPALAEQHRIVAYLDGLQAKVDNLKTLQEDTAKDLDALLPSILSKAFNGEL